MLCNTKGWPHQVIVGQQEVVTAHLEAICPEVWVLKELPEALHVPLPAHVGQVRHHVGNHFEARILGQVEAFTNCSYCVASVGIPRHILKDALQANFQSGTAIRQHLQCKVSLSSLSRHKQKEVLAFRQAETCNAADGKVTRSSSEPVTYSNANAFCILCTE